MAGIVQMTSRVTRIAYPLIAILLTCTAVIPDEPAGLPLKDAFLADLATPPTQITTVALRKETIAARPSTDLANDLPVVDFLW
jgi:hypothetical protein